MLWQFEKYPTDDFIVKNKESRILLNYITNLQKENEKLKDNQVRALNKIKDCISASKCEILEGNYSNDKHSQYWKLFNKQLKEIQKLIKGVNINQYINIPKYREKELLNKEEKLEDYKQRNEKTIDELFELKNMIYKPETREENFEIQRKISSIIKKLGLGGDE